MDKNTKVTIGILAHVDAGKTTLSEALLYKCGVIRKPGRVDHGDAFLDTDVQEKRRGITIFSKQAELELPASGGGSPVDVTILDTPGHVDFCSEMERTLQVLDYAILVINGREGVQGHSLLLWELLTRYKIPTFIFVNKMDLCARDMTEEKTREELMQKLKSAFDNGCVDFSAADFGADFPLPSECCEEVAMCQEELLDEFLDKDSIKTESIAKAIKSCCVFPCFFGSALKMEGIDKFVSALTGLTKGEDYPENGPVRARVYKINRDSQKERLSQVKIISGILRPRMTVFTGEDGVSEEKVNQIRIYSGDRFRLADEAGPGSVCALTGLDETVAGQLIADERGVSLESIKPELEAVLTYSVILPEGAVAQELFGKLKQLEEEDPQLNVSWNERRQEIQIKLMGEVQIDVLKSIILSRIGMDVDFGEGQISYRETIESAVYGAGHFEPLRHYAEVHLLLEPLPRGSGLEFDSICSEDELDRNWQRLIMTHLKEKDHLGTLTGSPVTDLKITIAGGRAHRKHTEGGDFRQATYRAVRQALRKSLEAGQIILLEPWYDFRLDVPADVVGRAMSDVQRMGGNAKMPELSDTGKAGLVSLTGRAPVAEMKDYMTELAAYSRGYGHLTCSFGGYENCHNKDAVITRIAYDADRDTANSADSVFCSHGAGHTVGWKEADAMMHISLKKESEGPEADGKLPGGGISFEGVSVEEDGELEEIFKRTYGRGREKRKVFSEARELESEEGRRRRIKGAKAGQETLSGPEYLIVDGYNIIFAWEDLRELAKLNIDSAREALIDILCNYQGYRKCRLILVFDAYKVKGGERRTEEQDNITVVYTKEAETADSYIERATYEMAKEKACEAKGKRRAHNVRVATSDRLEQLIITGNDARKISATDFRREVEETDREIRRMLEENISRNRREHLNRIKIQ